MKRTVALRMIILVLSVTLAGCSTYAIDETGQVDYSELTSALDDDRAGTFPASNQEMPDEAQALMEAYMDAMKQGVHEAVKYVHFGDDWTEAVYLESNDRLLDYRIEKTEVINDGLVAFTIHSRTAVTDETGQTQGEGSYIIVYNFAARIDGEWRFITGVRHIPEVLKDNFDESKYSYNDPNIVDPVDVILPER